MNEFFGKIIALELHEQQQQRQQNVPCAEKQCAATEKNVNKKKYLSKVQTTHSAAKND